MQRGGGGQPELGHRRIERMRILRHAEEGAAHRAVRRRDARPARVFEALAGMQDRLLADAQRLRELVAHGAQVMVCGGRKMAEGVAQAWERILAGSGLSVAQLRTQGRYVEDVY